MSFFKSAATQSRGKIFGPCRSPVWSFTATFPEISPFTFSYAFCNPAADKSRVKYTTDFASVAPALKTAVNPKAIAATFAFFITIAPFKGNRNFLPL